MSTTEHLLLELAHPLVQADLRLLLRALAVLESSAGDTQTLLEVRRILEAG